MVTPNLVLNASISYASSNTVLFPMASRIWSLLILVCVVMCLVSYRLGRRAVGARGLERLERAHHHLE